MQTSRGGYAATLSISATSVYFAWKFPLPEESEAENQCGGDPGSCNSAQAAFTEASLAIASILVVYLISLKVQAWRKCRVADRHQLAKLALNETYTHGELADAQQNNQRDFSRRAGVSVAVVRANQQLVHCLRNCLTAYKFEQGLAEFDRVADRIGAGCKSVWSMALYAALEANESWRCEDFIWHLLELGDLHGNDFVNIVRYYATLGDAMRLTPVLSAVSRTDYQLDFVYRNKALAVCQTAGAAQVAEAVVDGTRHVRLDVVAYNILIRLYGNAGDLKRCKELVEEMRAASLKPTEVTFGIMIGVFVKNKDLDAASQVFEELARSGLEPNVVHYTKFIQGLVFAQLYDEAELVLDEMVLEGHITPDVVMYAALMKTLSEQGAIKPAIRLLRRMMKQGIKPQTRMFNTALNACSVQDMKPEDIVSVFDNLVELGLEPNTVTLSATVKALVRAWGHTEATELLRNFPARFRYKPTARVFQQLVMACETAGRSWQAEQVKALAREQDVSLHA